MGELLDQFVTGLKNLAKFVGIEEVKEEHHSGNPNNDLIENVLTKIDALIFPESKFEPPQHSPELFRGEHPAMRAIRAEKEYIHRIASPSMVQNKQRYVSGIGVVH